MGCIIDHVLDCLKAFRESTFVDVQKLSHHLEKHNAILSTIYLMVFQMDNLYCIIHI